MKADDTQIVHLTEKMVRERMEGESTGHDWWHVDRVRRLALHIAGAERGADKLVVQLAALMHDISDWKFNGGDESAGPRLAEEWLHSQGADTSTVERVCMAMESVTFRGIGVSVVPSTLEGKIVQDADRLDAIGAIGIARAFAYGGRAGREIFNPSEKPQLHRSFEEYRKSRSNTINHFHEKLLLRDIMNTDTGRKLAQSRHDFMVEYLNRFSMEWDGKL